MRDAKKADEETVFEFADQAEGCVHEVRARRPTTRERFEFEASLFRREGDRVLNRTPWVRIEFGKQLLTGIRKGTIGEGGRPVASDPEDEDYREDWRDVVAEAVPEIPEALARHFFEAVRPVPRDTSGLRFELDEEPGDVRSRETEEEVISDPLASSSGPSGRTDAT
jgi:hypothetical protein